MCVPTRTCQTRQPARRAPADTLSCLSSQRSPLPRPLACCHLHDTMLQLTDHAVDLTNSNHLTPAGSRARPWHQQKQQCNTLGPVSQLTSPPPPSVSTLTGIIHMLERTLNPNDSPQHTSEDEHSRQKAAWGHPAYDMRAWRSDRMGDPDGHNVAAHTPLSASHHQQTFRLIILTLAGHMTRPWRQQQQQQQPYQTCHLSFIITSPTLLLPGAHGSALDHDLKGARMSSSVPVT